MLVAEESIEVANSRNDKCDKTLPRETEDRRGPDDRLCRVAVEEDEEDSRNGNGDGSVVECNEEPHV